MREKRGGGLVSMISGSVVTCTAENGPSVNRTESVENGLSVMRTKTVGYGRSVNRTKTVERTE